MRKAAMTALVLALVAAIIWALALLGKTRKQNDIITGQERKLAGLTSELEQLQKDQDILQEKTLESSEEIRTEKERNSDLQNELKNKSQQLYQLRIQNYIF